MSNPQSTRERCFFPDSRPGPLQLARKMPRPQDVASDSHRPPHPAAGFVRRSPAQKGRLASRATAPMDPPLCTRRRWHPVMHGASRRHPATLIAPLSPLGSGQTGGPEGLEQFSHGRTASQVELGYKPRCAGLKASCPKPHVTGSGGAEVHRTPLGMRSAASHRAWARGAWTPRPPAVRLGGLGEAGQPGGLSGPSTPRGGAAVSAVFLACSSWWRDDCHHHPGHHFLTPGQPKAGRDVETGKREQVSPPALLSCPGEAPSSGGPQPAARPCPRPAVGPAQGHGISFSSCRVVHWRLDIKSSSFKDKNKGCRIFRNCGKIYGT